MSLLQKWVGLAALIVLLSCPVLRADKFIKEDGRKIPVVYDVDVVVVGGTSAGVAAAVEAARCGATVFLMASQSYVGEDICGTYRFWLEPNEMPVSELAQKIYQPQNPPANSTPGGRYVPTPMHVKRTLEQALIANHVKFLFNCYPTDILLDKDGSPAGVIMANRAGRQAVVANVIIDATPYATVARIANVPFEPFKAGKAVVKRVVVGGQPRRGEGILSSRKVPAPDWNPVIEKVDEEVAQKLRLGPPADWDRTCIEYTLEVEVNDISYASLAKADQKARDLTWSSNQLDASEYIFYIPADRIRAKTVVTEWLGAEKIDIAAFQPDSYKNLFVLNGCAAVSRTVAETMLRPLAYMELGMRVGAAAASQRNSKSQKVVCFGDSITNGGYPDLLAKTVDWAEVIKAGKNGCTSAEGLKRLDTEVIAAKPDIAVLLFGTNDSVLTAPDTFRVPVAQYEANLREMVERCRKTGIQPVLCTPPFIVAEEYYERHPRQFYDARGGLEAILVSYCEAVRRIGNETSVPVVDLYALFSSNPTGLAPDGVHPNQSGQQQIAQVVGEAIAKLKNTIQSDTDLAGIRVASSDVTDGVIDAGIVKEPLEGIRATQSGLDFIESKARALPVIGEYDVVVVGGGTGGAAAAIAAARSGAKTLVIEKTPMLGGISTIGLIGIYYFGNHGGFTAEMDSAVLAMSEKSAWADHANRDGTRIWNIEIRAQWFRSELLKAGGELWFNSIGCGAIVENGTVKGVMAATPMGRGAVLAKKVIDGTGSSDIAIAAGADYVFVESEDAAIQGTGLPYRNLYSTGPHRLHWYANTDITYVDDNDMLDVWRAYVYARERFVDCYDLAQLINSRERRRIVGDFTLSPLDIINHRTYEDSIQQARSNLDTHGFTIHPVFMLRMPDHEIATPYVPYRCLLPKGLEGVLVIGLGVSAHRDAMPTIRMQPDIQNQGYAAGLAAAMTAKENKTLRQIDIKKLQKLLVEKGCVPESVLTDKDSYPYSKEQIAEAVRNTANDYQDIGIVLAQLDDSLPLLRDAYKTASQDKVKIIYANVLGAIGDPTGAETLIKVVESSPWDEGWNFRTGGQFGSNMSRLDSIIMSLGKTGSKQAVAPLIEKARQLDAKSAFSHHRAVAIAFENIGDSRAAEILAELLSKPEMSGYALKTKNSSFNKLDTDRMRTLREIILARALYRCGDWNGIGEKTLRQYLDDPRGLYSRHAKMVLMEK